VLEGNTLVDGGLTTGPAARGRPAVTFDRARGRVVMFGGSASDSQFAEGSTVDDVLWVWNGQRWERQQPAEARPSGREFTALTFDDNRDVVVMFGGAGVGDCDGVVGGSGASVLCPSVVWEWDGAAWTRKPAVGDVPQARQGHSMVYDEVRQRVLLFGGQTATQTTCDGRAEVTCSTLWSWDGNTWQRLVPRDDEGDGNPPGRSVFLFAFDRARGETVLVSGDTRLLTRTEELNNSNDAALTWIWNGARWRRTSADRLVTSILGGAAWYDPNGSAWWPSAAKAPAMPPRA
jgi:hypothetical protein